MVRGPSFFLDFLPIICFEFSPSAHCEVARSTHARERVVSSLQFKVGGDNQRRP